MTQLETVNRIGTAQSLIGEMVESGKANITPCNNCEFATKKGCIKESFSSVSGVKEIGPIYDPSEGAVVCPKQDGVIFINKNLEREAQSRTTGKLSKAIRNLSDEERRRRRDKASGRTLGVPIVKI